jgi:hypothetical protein
LRSDGVGNAIHFRHDDSASLTAFFGGQAPTMGWEEAFRGLLHVGRIIRRIRSQHIHDAVNAGTSRTIPAGITSLTEPIGLDVVNESVGVIPNLAQLQKVATEFGRACEVQIYHNVAQSSLQ